MTTRTTCRVCTASMTDLMSLGNIVPVDFIQPGAEVRPASPLTLCVCHGCGLVQLRDMLDRDTLFRQYWYLSGLNPTMISALRDVVESIKDRVTLEPGDVVIDIGANDGTMLEMYDESLHKIGFEPARNLAEWCAKACDTFVNDYFETYSEALPKAKVITSIAMFYDLDHPRQFVRKIAGTLRDDGIWVMQMTDLIRMLRANAFDNICHEHVCYYSLEIFKKLVETEGLEVFDVEFNDVNGASVRVYIGHHGKHEVRSALNDALADEWNYLEHGGLERFRDSVQSAKDKIVGFIRTERAAGKTFHALGASTKGNTLLQYFGLTNNDIVYASEVSPDKIGLVMAGSNVPIIHQDDSIAWAPDYYLVLPWHFLDFLIRKHADYLDGGGKMLAPLPVPTLYGSGGDARRL